MYKIIRRLDDEDDVYFDAEYDGIKDLATVLSEIADDMAHIGSSVDYVEYWYSSEEEDEKDDGCLTIQYSKGVAKVRIGGTGRIISCLVKSIEMSSVGTEDKDESDYHYIIHCDDFDVKVDRKYFRAPCCYHTSLTINEYPRSAILSVETDYTFYCWAYQR